MAGKRTAGSDLNHENWDQDDEPEVAGSFQRASREVIQKRVIKTAKRRNPISSNDETEKKAVFGSFSGFTKAPATSTAFAFLNNITANPNEPPTVNGINKKQNTQQNSVNASMFKVPELKTSLNEKDDEYYAKLKGLNESVSNWIKKHVDANPFINLTPIFKDYERYFEGLEPKKGSSSHGKTKANPAALKNELSSFVFKPTETSKTSAENKSATPQFSFGSNSNKKEKTVIFGANKETDTSPSFALNKTAKSDAATTTAPSFSFGSGPVTTTSAPTFMFAPSAKTGSSGFSFGSPTAKPFAFTNVAKPESNEEKNEQEQDEDEPPKVEFTPVVEDGHSFTVRCKVFVKNQDSFGDRGVGMLYLKPVPENDKTQLIVRADTNLGNLLCNFILSKSIPTKRMGKKDVMLVCLPTPESKPPPVPILLRVKSPEQADELLAELEKCKK